MTVEQLYGKRHTAKNKNKKMKRKAKNKEYYYREEKLNGTAS